MLQIMSVKNLFLQETNIDVNNDVDTLNDNDDDEDYGGRFSSVLDKGENKIQIEAISLQRTDRTII